MTMAIRTLAFRAAQSLLCVLIGAGLAAAHGEGPEKLGKVNFPTTCNAAAQPQFQRGVALLSPEEKIDTSSAAGELVFHVFGAIAQFERSLIAERTRDGIANARTKGHRPGRPPLDQDKREAALLLVQGGMSPTKAARQIGLGRSTLYRELQGQARA